MPRRALRSYPTKYATDLTDAQWAAIAPLVVTPSPNGGRPTDIDRRAIVNIRFICSEFRDMVMEPWCGLHNFRIWLKRKKHSKKSK